MKHHFSISHFLIFSFSQFLRRPVLTVVFTISHFLILSFSQFLFLSCATDGEGSGIVSEGLLTLPNVPDQWTYVSLRTGKVLGSCALADTAAQHRWANRSDWDMATCNGMIRTNGGASGRGMGGVATTTTDYEAVDAAQPAAYVTDRDTVGVW